LENTRLDYKNHILKLQEENDTLIKDINSIKGQLGEVTLRLADTTAQLQQKDTLVTELDHKLAKALKSKTLERKERKRLEKELSKLPIPSPPEGEPEVSC
jgi:hypothetical protein